MQKNLVEKLRGLPKLITVANVRRSIWVLPIFFIAWLIMSYGLNMPFGDEWSNITIYQKIDQGNLPVKSFFRQHNEHRIAFPSALSTVMAFSTKNNVKVQMFASLALAVVSLILLYSVLKQYSLLIALWWLTPIQAENWLWAFEICWFLGVLAVIACVKFLTQNDDIRKSIAAAIVASWSVGIGLVIWPVGLLILIIKKQPKRWWIISAVVSNLLYFHNYHSPAASGGPVKLLDFINYYLALLGGTITQSPQTAPLIGGLLLSLAVPLGYLVYKNKLKKGLFWLSLMVFTLVAMLLIAYGRSASGIPQALSSRYASFTVLYIVGLIGLALTLINKPIAKIIVVSISVPLLISSYLTGIATAKQLRKDRLVIKQCTQAVKPSVDCFHLVALADPLDVTQSRLDFLKSKGWSGYLKPTK